MDGLPDMGYILSRLVLYSKVQKLVCYKSLHISSANNAWAFSSVFTIIVVVDYFTKVCLKNN